MEPVVIDRATGKLIDGRNRVRACNHLGLVVETMFYDGPDVMQFVVSHNLHRRHLTDSQRAMIAGRLANRAPGYRTETAHLSVRDHGDITVIPPSRKEVTALLNVTETSLNKARVVLRDGTPAIQALVESGKAPVTTAARVSTMLSPSEQDEYAERVNNGMDPVAAAPMDTKQQEGRDRKRDLNPPSAPKRKANQHVSMLDSITETMRVWTTAVLPVRPWHASLHYRPRLSQADGARTGGVVVRRMREYHPVARHSLSLASQNEGPSWDYFSVSRSSSARLRM